MPRIVLVVLVALAACSGGDDDDVAERTTTTPPLHAEVDLADGTHFGFVTALDPTQLRLVFDKAELLVGDEAVAAAEEDGAVVSRAGSYVRNPDDRMNRVSFADGMVVRLLKPCCELHEVDFTDWLAGFAPDDRTFYGTASSHYEITIVDGEVSAVDEVLVE